MPQLHETGYGRRLFEHEIPELNRNLSKISEIGEHLEMISIYLGKIADAMGKNLHPENPAEPETEQSVFPPLSIFSFKPETPSPSHKFYLNTQDNIQDNISFLKSIEVFHNGQLFSVRIFNCLYGGFNKSYSAGRIPKRNLYELVTASEAELRQIRNFGTKCLFEIEQLLSPYKLKIDMIDEQINAVDLSDMRKCAVLFNDKN